MSNIFPKEDLSEIVTAIVEQCEIHNIKAIDFYVNISHHLALRARYVLYETNNNPREKMYLTADADNITLLIISEDRDNYIMIHLNCPIEDYVAYINSLYVIKSWSTSQSVIIFKLPKKDIGSPSIDTYTRDLRHHLSNFLKSSDIVFK